MTRVISLALGGATLLLAGLALGPAAGADGKAKDQARDIQVRGLRVGGGGRLGVRLEEVDKDDMARLKLKAERGALVKSVEPDSPAQKAGLKEGDVIVSYEGENVRSASQLARLVRETPVGRAVTIEVSRDGSPQTLTATLAEGHMGGRLQLGDLDLEMPEMPAIPPIPELAPAPPAPPVPPDIFREGRGRHPFLFDRAPRKLGIECQDITGQLARYFNVEGGVLVTSVDEDSPAARAGLRAGDVIVRFEGKPVTNGGDLREGVGRADSGQEVTVGVQREGRTVDLKLKLAPSETRRSGDVKL